MIQYLQHNEIDKAKWDATIAAGGNIYARSWYLDIVHPHWEALVDDDYQCVMPLTGGQKFGVDYLFQPFFVQQLGVFSKAPLSSEKTEAFLEAIPDKYHFAEIRLNENNRLKESVQGIEYHRNVLLDLNQDYAALRAGYHTNTKRNLSKAESHGLQVTDSVELDQIIDLFRDNRGATVSVWGDTEYATLLRLGEATMKRDAAFLVGVTDGVEMLCGALFMQTADRITFLFSGCGQPGKQKQAMTFMMDQVIQRHAGQPMVFDFEGSDDENLARFYLGFGGMETKYPSYTFNNMSALGKGILRVWKKRK